MSYSILKVGFHRGNKRVWLQGSKLTEAGFPVGKQYLTSITDNSIMLVSNETVLNIKEDERTRKVSKKPSKTGPIPVIDMNSKAISLFFGDACACSVFYGDELIMITRSK